MKPTHDSLLLRVSCLRTHQTVFNKENSYHLVYIQVCEKLLERFSIAFTANGKRKAEISRLPKTREIYLVSAYILPVSHSYGVSTKNREIS